MLVGPKRSGKGTIGRVVTGLLGRHNVAGPTLSGMATNFGLSPLIGRPLGIVSDARLSARAEQTIIVERLLSISGEDSLTIDRKYRDPWTGQLPTRFVILTNEIPALVDSSGALASRFVVAVMSESFYGKEDHTLTEQLLAEAPGIFTWSLAGLDRLRERGYFVQPESANEAIDALADLASPIALFVKTRCELGPTMQTDADSLFREWLSWCEAEGIKNAGTRATLGRDLQAAVPAIRKHRPGPGAATCTGSTSTEGSECAITVETTMPRS